MVQVEHQQQCRVARARDHVDGAPMTAMKCRRLARPVRGSLSESSESVNHALQVRACRHLRVRQRRSYCGRAMHTRFQSQLVQFNRMDLMRPRQLWKIVQRKLKEPSLQVRDTLQRPASARYRCNRGQAAEVRLGRSTFHRQFDTADVRRCHGGADRGQSLEGLHAAGINTIDGLQTGTCQMLSCVKFEMLAQSCWRGEVQFCIHAQGVHVGRQPFELPQMPVAQVAVCAQPTSMMRDAGVVKSIKPSITPASTPQ